VWDGHPVRSPDCDLLPLVAKSMSSSDRPKLVSRQAYEKMIMVICSISSFPCLVHAYGANDCWFVCG
jgi:hypothetical protein